eukprot:Phypoly_transcript_15133.p1 GENE.Phypoly_transcript_15133~~Phypoly_transcript_15133.p1  ORF type:complete len:235 (+),score=61.05 Phypoly_transcript_15133:188-892(+)
MHSHTYYGGAKKFVGNRKSWYYAHAPALKEQQDTRPVNLSLAGRSLQDVISTLREDLEAKIDLLSFKSKQLQELNDSQVSSEIQKVDQEISEMRQMCEKFLEEKEEMLGVPVHKKEKLHKKAKKDKETAKKMEGERRRSLRGRRKKLNAHNNNQNVQKDSEENTSNNNEKDCSDQSESEKENNHDKNEKEDKNNSKDKKKSSENKKEESKNDNGRDEGDSEWETIEEEWGSVQF